MSHDKQGTGGEGNVEADRRYREKTREFVESGDVDAAAKDAADRTDEQQDQDRAAAERAKSRARG